MFIAKILPKMALHELTFGHEKCGARGALYPYLFLFFQMYFRIIRKMSTWNNCLHRQVGFSLTASLQDADIRLGPPVVETTGYNTVPLQGT
jgi:hypothetical protein